MGQWKIVVPEATTNLFTDPSFFLADPDTEWTFAGDGTEDWTRGTTYQFFGIGSAVVALGGGTYADLRQTVTTTATDYTLSCYVRRSAGGVPTASHTRAYFDDAVQDWDSITSIGNGWYYCVYTATATAAANAFGVRALEASMCVDGVQLENKAYVTTYVDGTRDGCEWNGAAHTSTSSRSAMSRAGGRLMDLDDDYSLLMDGMTGFGMPPTEQDYDPYAILPGGSIEGVKEQASVITLFGTFKGTSVPNVHALRQALIEELAPDKYPQGDFGPQPVLLRYYDTAVVKEVELVYEGGLEGSIRAIDQLYYSDVAIRLRAQDPRWYEIGNSAAVLDSNDTATFRYCAGRLKSTGQWSNLGLTANPATGGTITAIHVGSDNRVYFGGGFTNWDGNADRDRLVAYNIGTATWETVGGAGAFDNGTIYSIIEGADGTLYIGGTFTNIVDADGDYIVTYDIATDTLSSLSSGGTGTVNALAIDSTGKLYIGGKFDDWNAIASADGLVAWTGTAYAAVGAPAIAAATEQVFAIAIDSKDNVYIGGDFTNVAGEADADYLAWWNGSAWDAVSETTPNDIVYSLLFDTNDILYLSGAFTDLGGNTSADCIASYNGASFSNLGTGLDDAARHMRIGPDGMLYLAGWFSTAGDLTMPDYIARWNGSSWTHHDIGFSGGFQCDGLALGRADPTISQNYDVFLGFRNTGAVEHNGKVEVPNPGTASQHPMFKIKRSGGTSATLYTIRNESTGKELMFAYSLLDGETLTIDCRSKQRGITSSFFGKRPGAILANSDFGSFTLLPGDNNITCFVDVVGAPTIEAWVEFRAAYKGAD